jgi:release factor glutamine methyltransferase
MAANVLDYEPHMALFVEDTNALIFYKALAKQSADLLKTGGSIYVEIHERLGEATQFIFEELGFVNIVLRKDLQGKDRMLKAQKP